MREFLNYLAVEPFEVAPHLKTLWLALDVENRGFIDFRELACYFRYDGVATVCGARTSCDLTLLLLQRDHTPR